jgi:2-succinyl-6-hydroxy-2,4-cyclohexadiene-1-carboxylate synthase
MIVFLHGFWGAPADWSGVLAKLPLHLQTRAPDLYEPGPLAPHHSLTEWTAHFLEWLGEEAGGLTEVTLIGYSMGARMALSALAAAPHRFARALLISGRPWLDESEREQREQWEVSWRARFLSDDWSKLEGEWQEQGVFSGSAGLERRRSEVLRERLGQSLVHWSPRHHGFGKESLKVLPSRFEWAFGALDQKYLNVAKSLQELPVQGQIHIIPNAGHRVPVDQPDFIARWITKAR